MAIEVLERCTRFHIFCSAFLSEYPRDAFDPKLNDKMLIGCLDQLHECYITHKQSNNQSALKNLAEFTSYMLLINLREDNETLLYVDTNFSYCFVFNGFSSLFSDEFVV